MKKGLFVLVFFLLAVFFVSAAGQKDSKVLKIGTMPNNLGAPAVYAQEQGLFAKAGLDVDVIIFPSGAPINEALSAKQIDGALTGLAGVYALASGECKWLGDIDVSMSGLSVYVRPDSPVLKHKGLIPGKPNVYGNAETIKGLTFLGPLGTSAQFNAISWAQCFGLSSNDIKMLHMEFGPALQAFIAGEGDALPTSPPFHYQAEEKGAISVAPLTEVSGMELCNGIVFRNEIVESRRLEVKKFLEVIYSVIDLFASNDNLYAEFAFDFYNKHGRKYTREMVQREIVERDFTGKKFMSRPEYRFGPTMIGMGNFYVNDGKIAKEDFPNIIKSMDPSFLEEIYGIKIKIFGE
ncbi:MAG: ABC transporter substrate-binding protein [Spirochaetales bacterium]|nr:ABC transporter substrate-binding protein [Spirochaetales bacterium]